MLPILDSKLVNVMDKYSNGRNLGSSLNALITKASQQEMIVPVIGMQGMGKSTLINGILKENIMPNNADETTCVPVEVRYGTSRNAEVFFKNSASSVTIKTQDELAQYVDNNFNPANQKGVSRIVLYRDLELLKTGIVIVDLPGVGSLTTENQLTTERYVESLATAIFVIPTTPTIRKMESTVIKSAWAQFANVTFVQNDWDESLEDLKDSVDYNSGILRDIAKKINRKFDGNIIVVNAYNAIAGVVQNDLNLVKSSNIKTLEEHLKNVAANWNNILSKNIENIYKQYLSFVEQAVLKELQKLQMSAQDVVNMLKQEYMQVLKESNDFKDSIKNILAYLENKKISLESFLKKESTECANKIRSRVYRVIDGGITDGKNLDEAFKTTQEAEVSDFYNKVLDEFLKIQVELEEKLEKLRGSITEKVVFTTFEGSRVNRPESLKFEKGLAWGIGIGGTIGGAFVAGSILAGGLTIATGGLALVAAAGISAVAGIISYFTKKGIGSVRKDNAKKTIDPIIDKVKKTAYEESIKQYGSVCDKVKEALRNLQASLQKELKDRYTAAMQPPKPTTDEIQLKTDLDFLKQKEI